MAALVDGALERHGKVDLLVNNAGGQYLTPAEDINPKGFRTVMRLNVEGTWLMTHAVATKAMIPAGGGKVLSVTLSPHNGMPGMAHSGAARAAVENMMRTLSVEWARFGIKLNALAAGQFATDTLLTKYPKQIVDGVAASVPQQRMGEPEELAWLVAYLASPAGDFTSGSVITVDGARDNWMGPWPPQAIAGDVRQRGAPKSASRSERRPPDTGGLRDDPRGARAVLGRARPAPGPPPGAGARVRRHVGGAARRRPAGGLPVRLRGGQRGLRAPGRRARRAAPPGPGHAPVERVRGAGARARRHVAQGHHHADQRDVDRLPHRPGHGRRARGRLRRPGPRPDRVHARDRGRARRAWTTCWWPRPRAGPATRGASTAR